MLPIKHDGKKTFIKGQNTLSVVLKAICTIFIINNRGLWQNKQLCIYFSIVGTLNGSVTIWDTARQMIRHSCAKSDEDHDHIISAGVTKMIWIKDRLLTGCLDGSLRVYEGRSGERSTILTGHWSEILDLVYNAKENIVLTTSDDGTARIFKYPVQNDND